MMRAQQVYLLRTVKIVRGQLVNHKIANSNLAETTFNQR